MNRMRRQFLAQVGQGMLTASVGANLAMELGLSPLMAAEPEPLRFGELEYLVSMMQATPLESLQRTLIAKHRDGVSLKTLASAAALANARSFGGQDYDGYHTFMAIGPALDMSNELSDDRKLLPLLKVCYRNTNRIQQQVAKGSEAMSRLERSAKTGEVLDGETLRKATREADLDHAEELFAAIAEAPPNEAYNHLQFAIQDEVDVHRTVLAWRAWMMLDITGPEHAHTLLRQSVRYCVDAEQRMKKNGSSTSAIRSLLPRLMNDFRLLDRPIGQILPSDTALLDLAQSIFAGTREQGATAVATALSEGFSTEAIGEAISLAANRLLLNDPGRTEAQASEGKPVGSIHGASVGVHAMDSANAWRNIARVSNHRNQIASLIVGAFHTAGQSGSVQKGSPSYEEEMESLKNKSTSDLLRVLDDSVRLNDQKLACAIVSELELKSAEPNEVFRTLLPYAVSEDGALHAEKFYRTTSEEFQRSRPSWRWKYSISLARVTASEFGNPAPGQAEARELLGLS